MNNDELFEKALKHWGEDNQIKVVVEELAELIVAIAKMKRKHNGSSLDDIIDEIADVYLMTGQLKYILRKNNPALDINKMILDKYLEKRNGVIRRIGGTQCKDGMMCDKACDSTDGKCYRPEVKEAKNIDDVDFGDYPCGGTD